MAEMGRSEKQEDGKDQGRRGVKTPVKESVVLSASPRTVHSTLSTRKIVDLFNHLRESQASVFNKRSENGETFARESIAKKATSETKKERT
jgi:hypothetical protein